MPAYSDLSDDALFAQVLERRARGEDVGTPLGVLVERWRKPAGVVVRRIQASYRAGAPEDEPELYQEAVQKLIDRGLDQYRGVSEHIPGKSASPKTFFLRIVKHLAIDRYRRHRELLAQPREDEEGEHRESAAEVARAVGIAQRARESRDAKELYWTAYRRLQTEHPGEAAAWDVYHHQDVEDHEACARQLNISVANSYKRVSRAQAYLRRYLLELERGSDGDDER